MPLLHDHLALHDEPVAGEGADVGVFALRGRRGEAQHLAVALVEHFGFVQDLRGVGDEAFGEAVGRFGHFVAGHADFVRGAGLDDEEIVRGDVGIFEDELHGGSGSHFELAQVVEQALGDGFDGDGLQAGLRIEGVRRLGLLLFRHQRGFGGLAVFEELFELGMLRHEGGVALPKRLQRVAVERGAQRVGEVRVHRVLQEIERGLQGLRRADVTRRDGRFEADEA